jgi:PPK2 family polyphosphate:nucleotide phosphotransferase
MRRTVRVGLEGVWMADEAAHIAHRVDPGAKVHLDDIDSGGAPGIDRAEGERRLEKAGAELSELQELLHGAASRSVLIILQGMDTSGKDGTIRRAFTWLNPQGCDVTSFKEPTDDELGHDFLWRVHRVCPAKGFIAIFNRSQYEDVLVARVRKLVPKDVWSARYEQINEFERLLVDTGTIVLKFFLHIGRSEQQKRLLDREREPDKAWKLSVSDWEDRQDWKGYQKAYEEALERCSTAGAPWYIVPADHRWYRDLAVAETVVARLRQHKNEWESELRQRGRQQVDALQRYREEHPPG